MTSHGFLALVGILLIGMLWLAAPASGQPFADATAEAE